MEDSDSKEATLVADQAQAALLTDPRALRYLAPFLIGEQTLSSAAAATGVAPSTMAYWLPRFLAAGLIRVASRRKRAGMASTCYRAAADLFLVDADQQRIEALRAYTAAALSEHISIAMGATRVTRTFRLAIKGRTAETVEVRADPGTAGNRELARLAIETVRLSHRQAQALWDDLTEVIARHQAGGGTGTEYLVQLAVAPTDPRRPS